MMRRALLRLLASGMLAQRGDGLIPPLNAPDAPGMVPGVQPGTTPNVVVANRVIVFGPGGAVVGVFVYSGPPAPGNPPVAWTSLNSADPYGNALPSGTGIVIGTQGAGTVIGLGQGELIGYAAGELPGGIQFPGSNDIRIVSPLATALDTPAQIDNYSASTFGLQRHVFSGHVIATAGTPAHPTLITTDTWNPLTLANGWGAPALGPAPSYRLTTDNEVELCGELRQAAAPTSATIATLPAGYRPSTATKGFAAGCNTGVTAGTVAWLQVDTAGNLTLQNVVLGNPIVLFYGRIPLDAF